MKILVTGSAGFIGFHLVNALIKQRAYEVVGIDSLNNYYDVRIKMDRLDFAGINSQKVAYNENVVSTKFPSYTFKQLNLEDAANLERLFAEEKFDIVCNLAAQAGVRYSLKNPHAYMQSNVIGFFNILEASRHHQIKHLVYASSSSVYGMNKNVPYSTSDKVDNPISFYAATKKTNELMAHTYSNIYKLPTTGLRFFTVYGPWGRPDMAYFLFVDAILKNRSINVFNHGKMERDFTYVDDIVNGLEKVLAKIPEKPDETSENIPYKIYNIGNSKPIKLMDFIDSIEKVLGKKAKKNFLEMQAGDVVKTFADITTLSEDYNYKPSTELSKGVERFVSWYLDYYNIKNS